MKFLQFEFYLVPDILFAWEEVRSAAKPENPC